MKIALLVVGLIVAVLGIAGALYGLAVASWATTTYALTCTGTFQEPYPGWCASLLSSASTYRTLAYGMFGVFALGVVVSVAGAVMRETGSLPSMIPAMMPPQPAPPPGPTGTCRACGAMVPVGNRFCANCGAPVA